MNTLFGVRVSCAVIAFVLLGVGGCTIVPQQEFSEYTQAFNEAKSATEQLLLDLDTSKKIVEKIKNTRNPPAVQAGPFPLKVDLAAFGSPEIDPVGARRVYLEAVSKFNTVLTDLAAGKKPEEVRNSVDSLISGLNNVAGLIGETLPIPGVAGGLISTVIGQLQQARNRQQFVAALQAGAPIVDGILDLFRKDAEDVYTIMAGVATIDADHQTDLVFDLSEQMKKVAADHKAPEGDVAGDLGKIEKKLRIVLDQAGLTEQQGHMSNLPTTGDNKFDRITLSQLQQTLVQAEAAAVKYTAIIDKQKAYHDLVVSYGLLLLKTRQTLSVARGSLDKPADLRAQATELIEFVFNVKRDWEAVQLARHSAGGG